MIVGADFVVFPVSKEIYNLKKPQQNIQISFKGATEEVGLISFAYIPTEVPRPSLDDAAVMRSPKQWNNDYYLPILSSRKEWEKRGTPQFVVLVREEMVSGKTCGKRQIIYKGGTVYQWPQGIVVVQGHPDDWPYQIVGSLSGKCSDEDIYHCDEATTTRIIPPPYTGDPFSVSKDGHYVGNDGYIIPKTFAEFYEKHPNYVRRWASKWLHKSEDDDAVRDWEQDLLLYLHYLPETSRARTPNDRHPKGCTDVIQCFDPFRQYGASERRFRNYLNICLHNRSLTINGRQSKNPIYRRDNLAIGTPDENDVVVIDDEYVHSHSEALERKAEEASANVEKRILVKRFMEYVLDAQPELYDTLLAISETGTLRDAQEVLGVDEATFNRDRKRIIQLKEAFMDGGPVQKQRKPYKKRAKVVDLRYQVTVTEITTVVAPTFKSEV